VEILALNPPFINNVQLVPNVKDSILRVVAEIKTLAAAFEKQELRYTIREYHTNKIICEGKSHIKKLQAYNIDTIDFSIAIPGCKLWTPERPFLYRIELRTSTDSYTTHFGMRTFTFDTTTLLPVLNGKTYYLHGTNFALHRFLEDSIHGSLPWDEKWVRKLICQAKAMNCNITRLHIGFAPEMWYNILDEEGIMVQDEYAIWGGLMEDTIEQKRFHASTLIAQFTDWMRERWNHPCVIIWDAMNETKWKGGTIALNAVRHLDLSNRSWDWWMD